MYLLCIVLTNDIPLQIVLFKVLYFRVKLKIKSLFKGIVQPLELGGVTRLIQSALKNWRSGKLKKNLMI
jgi:hypothetical protein